MNFIVFVIMLTHQVSAGTATLSTCINIEYDGRNQTKIPCRKNGICLKKFHVLRVHFPPYAYFSTFESVMDACCGNCKKKNYIIHKVNNISEVTPAKLSRVDFSYPFLGSTTATILYGQYFIPVWAVPSAFYITRVEEIDLMDLVLNLYPVVIICVTMAILSGFIVWLFEKESNAQDFQRPFLIGWFDGIWFAFITMATVGYGDKTPKTIIGKLFSIVWVSIGVIGFAIVAGKVTIAVMKIDSPDAPDMENARVATLRFHDFDQYLITQHGGRVVTVNYDNLHNGFSKMVAMLRQEKIDGFLLDKWTLRRVTQIIQVLNKDKKVTDKTRGQITYFMQETIRTEKTINWEKFSYGILVRDREIYEYFRNAFTDNRLREELRLSLSYVRQKTRSTRKYGNIFYSEMSHLFSPQGAFFGRAIATISCLIGAILVFGVYYEWKRRREFAKASDKSSGQK